MRLVEVSAKRRLYGCCSIDVSRRPPLTLSHPLSSLVPPKLHGIGLVYTSRHQLSSTNLNKHSPGELFDIEGKRNRARIAEGTFRLLIILRYDWRAPGVLQTLLLLITLIF